MAWNVYATFAREQHESTQIDLELDNASYDIRILLVTGSYTPATSTHRVASDVTANEVSGTNYTAYGNECTTPLVTETGGTVTFDANDPATWSQSGTGFSNARRAIMIQYNSGTPANSRLVAYSDDFGADKGNVTGDLSITLDATGIFTIAV